MECPRAFLYSINKIKKKSASTATVFGNIVHDVLDQVYTEENTKESFIDNAIDEACEKLDETVLDRELEEISAKAFAVLSEYVKYYKNDFKENKYGKPEEVFDIPSGEDDIYARRRGKIDGQFVPKKTNENWILERKTKGQIQLDKLITYLSMDFQSLFYTLAKENLSGKKIVGVLYDVIRNPGTRLKQNEKLPDYIERLRTEIRKAPDYYFMRIEVPFSDKDKEQFRKELIRKVKDIFFKLKACEKARPCEVFYRNQQACLGKWTCDYIEACTTDSLRDYYVDKQMFKELTK